MAQACPRICSLLRPSRHRLHTDGRGFFLTGLRVYPKAAYPADCGLDVGAGPQALQYVERLRLAHRDEEPVQLLVDDVLVLRLVVLALERLHLGLGAVGEVETLQASRLAARADRAPTRTPVRRRPWCQRRRSTLHRYLVLVCCAGFCILDLRLAARLTCCLYVSPGPWQLLLLSAGRATAGIVALRGDEWPCWSRQDRSLWCRHRNG